MKIAIIGYGQMGRKVEESAKMNGIEVIARVDPKDREADYSEIREEFIRRTDICIDFSHPDSVLNNIELISKYGKNIVIGTTAWYDKLENVKEIIKRSRTGFVYAPNFSLGMNLFYKIIESASTIFNNFPEYDVAGMEMHHNRKADSPSGTAKILAKIIMDRIYKKNKALYDISTGTIHSDELHFASMRCGSIPGTHKIMFDSPQDTIEISHIVRNRDGFASGAILAAKWIFGKKGFYSFEDVINNILTNEKE
jgi:4-hydroxy-tetrahydrodipicolinate reductase